MTLSFNQFSVHEKVYPTVRTLLVGVKAILGDRFFGMYLGGSLALGDFDPSSSDIDFIVITAEPLPDEVIKDLIDMHKRFMDTGYLLAGKLEGSYIPKRDLRDTGTDNTPFLSINERKLYMSRHDGDWVLQRYILREHGVVLEGPDPKTLINPICPEKLKRAVVSILHEWWEPMLCDQLRLSDSEYQAFAVLTMCRALYTLEYGDIVSKRAAADWALKTLDRKWKDIIQKLSDLKPATDFDMREDVMLFIRYTLNRSRIRNLNPL